MYTIPSPELFGITNHSNCCFRIKMNFYLLIVLMTLYDRLLCDYKEAMKNKSEIKKTVLNLVLAKIKNKEIELQKTLEDADIITILKKEVKEILETIGFLQRANKSDDVLIEEQKKSLIEFYLPATMTKEQTTDLIKKLIADYNITDLRTQRGLVMKELMANYKEQIDGALVNDIINEMI
ncbi:MAG: GatB/YqeY domain-containing protein [bacterium]